MVEFVRDVVIAVAVLVTLMALALHPPAEAEPAQMVIDSPKHALPAPLESRALPAGMSASESQQPAPAR
jgi:hypothetical protein